MKITLLNETLLKRTTSRCPVCRAQCPAEVWRVSEGKQTRVFLKKLCAEHGASAVCISSDARFYWLAQGDPQNACCGGKACSAGDGGIDGTLGQNVELGKHRTSNIEHRTSQVRSNSEFDVGCSMFSENNP